MTPGRRTRGDLHRLRANNWAGHDRDEKARHRLMASNGGSAAFRFLRSKPGRVTTCSRIPLIRGWTAGTGRADLGHFQGGETRHLGPPDFPSPPTLVNRPGAKGGTVEGVCGRPANTASSSYFDRGQRRAAVPDRGSRDTRRGNGGWRSNRGRTHPLAHEPGPHSPASYLRAHAHHHGRWKPHRTALRNQGFAKVSESGAKFLPAEASARKPVGFPRGSDGRRGVGRPPRISDPRKLGLAVPSTPTEDGVDIEPGAKIKGGACWAAVVFFRISVAICPPRAHFWDPG